MTKSSQPHSGKCRRKKRGQIDLSAFLKKPVKVAKDGRKQKMTPFEISLRAQVRKALKEKSLPAIMNMLGVALAYELIKPAPVSERRGGVLVVHGRLTKESWAALFKTPDQDNGSDKSSKSSGD